MPLHSVIHILLSSRLVWPVSQDMWIVSEAGPVLKGNGDDPKASSGISFWQWWNLVQTSLFIWLHQTLGTVCEI